MSGGQILLAIIAGGLVIVAILVFQIVWTLRAARSLNSSLAMTTARAALLIGAATGLCCGLFVRWQASDDLRCVGFPVPGVLLQLEDGRWVDYVGPMTLISPLLNSLIFASLFTLPHLAFTLIARRRHS